MIANTNAGVRLFCGMPGRPEVRSSYNAHVKIIIAGLAALLVMGLAAKKIMTPSSFGDIAHYRADSIQEQADLEIKYGSNASCSSCHERESYLHAKGLHKTISCEFCHGPYANHVNNGKKTKALPVKAGEDMKSLCLRCHNKSITARPKDVIKTIVMPDHLKDQNVRVDHTCNQCHLVHAPLEYVRQARRMMGMEEPEQ